MTRRLSDVTLSYDASGTDINAFRFTGSTASGAAVSLHDETEGGVRTMQMQSADAGAVLRFLDIYEHMVGGVIKFALSGPVGGTLTGQVDTANFELVNEPRLRSIVSTAPQGDGRSLNEAVKRDIDTSRVKFERGFAAIAKGNGRAGAEERRAARPADRLDLPGHALRQGRQHGHDRHVHAGLRPQPHLRRAAAARHHPGQRPRPRADRRHLQAEPATPTSRPCRSIRCR